MGFSQEDESEKPEAAWENPVLVIVRGIKYNESYKMLTGGICMGSYLNPGNEAFAVALNSEIYVDKTGLLTYTNKGYEYSAGIYLQQSPATVWKIDHGQYAHGVLQQRLQFERNVFRAGNQQGKGFLKNI